MDTTIILLIVNVFAAVAVIGLTLIQQPKGDMGSAFGGGGSQSMFGSRGSANFLTKSTSWMCFVFFASSLSLAYLYAQKSNNVGVVDQSVIQEVSELPSIIEASGNSDASDSDLPSIPAEEVTGAVDSVIDTAEEVVGQAEEAVQDATSDVENVIEETVEAVEKESDQ